MPRVMATSVFVILRGGSGRRALWPDKQRPVGGEGDLEVGLAGDRAHAADHRPLERLGRSFGGLCPRCVVRDGHGFSVSSSPRSPSIPAVPR